MGHRLSPSCYTSGKITSNLRSRIHDAREAALGPQNTRTAHKPTKKLDGSYEGGTPFERDDHAMNVANSQRCYTLAQSYQVQRNTVGPAAAVKIGMGQEPSAHLRLREQIIQVRGVPCNIAIILTCTILGSSTTSNRFA